SYRPCRQATEFPRRQQVPEQIDTCGCYELQYRYHHQGRQYREVLPHYLRRNRLRLQYLKPRWSVQRRLPLSWTVLRSSFLPRFSHRLLALALWFIFFQLGFFTSFFSSFTYRWQAFNCPAFIEFTLCNGAWGRVTPNNEELLSNCPKVGGRPVNQDTDWEVETTDGKNRRECIQHDLLGLSKLTGLRC